RGRRRRGLARGGGVRGRDRGAAPGPRRVRIGVVADALVVIDIQNEYFAGGAIPLPDAEGAATRAAEAIAAARAAGIRVFHVRHEEPGSDEWFVPGSRGAETHAAVEPAEGEPVIVKH